MDADDVLHVLNLLRRAGTDVWIGGGWEIGALVGRQTRDHRDLDLMHRQKQEPAVVAALAAAGFVESLDGRHLHPLVFARDGSAVQASGEPERPFGYPASCFVTGTVGGTAVPCLSAEQQVYFHQGYEPSERDRHDMAQLRRVFGIATHF
ncbi:nucleotidyltransferase domain-containing protein [Streptomyces canus]|uniref:nucleotidyltransferase domain-containing protein n=1 Tax=Streptomyces canus TaxID=58343 RepID=UPI002785AF63|nr:amino acid transporter [Streptomyces canus]MDQ1069010.1 lincosamide nucleotidyltransferase A/C/D/E [Streptomyces canus]